MRAATLSSALVAIVPFVTAGPMGGCTTTHTSTYTHTVTYTHTTTHTSSTSTSASASASVSLPPGVGLNTVAQANGKLYFGTATDNPEWNDTKYDMVLNEHYQFGQLTPANYMKWEFTEPEQNVFNYSGGDALVAIAHRDHDLVRCHNLVWYNELPRWLTNPTVPWTNATLMPVMINHINNLVTHWASDCYAWDVVNEALNDDGTWRETIFYNVTGPAYVGIAFKAAAAAAKRAGHPEIKLYYNDYNIEYPGVKSAAALQIVQSLQNQSIKIDGVGLQSHFIVGETPSRASQVQNMESFTSLNLDVAITELDIRFTNATLGSPSNITAQEMQASDYENTVGACKDVKRCVGITLWDFTDKYSWIPGTFAGQGAALPWDENINVKPIVYDGIVAGLES